MFPTKIKKRISDQGGWLQLVNKAQKFEVLEEHFKSKFRFLNDKVLFKNLSMICSNSNSLVYKSFIGLTKKIS